MISYLFRTISDNQLGGSLEDLNKGITLPSLAAIGTSTILKMEDHLKNFENGNGRRPQKV